jgi:lipopolysaccharide exporter
MIGQTLFMLMSKTKDWIFYYASKNTSVLVFSNIFLLIVRLLSSVILTRILEPTAFAIVAIITAVQMAAALLSDMGFFQYVVRRKDYDEPDFLNEIWTLRLVRSLLLAAVLLALAEPISIYVKIPELELALVVASLSPILDGLASMAFATATRKGQIVRLSLLDASAAVAGVLASVILCLWLQSFWGIIFGGFVGSIIKLILSYSLFEDSRRRWKWSKDRARDVWLFGRYILPSSAMTLLLGQLDKFVLAPLLGVYQFGLYALGANLASAPNAIVGQFVDRLLFPAFSEMHSRASDGVAQIYYSYSRNPRWILLFSFSAFSALSAAIVDILYDDRYAFVASYLSILSLCSIISLMANTANAALVSLGEVKVTMKISAMRLITLIASGYALFVFLGPLHIVPALVISLVVTQIYIYFKLHKAGIFRLIGELKYISVALAGYGVGWIVNFGYMTYLT